MKLARLALPLLAAFATVLLPLPAARAVDAAQAMPLSSFPQEPIGSGSGGQAAGIRLIRRSLE